jgi:hypothetical protein
MGLAIGVFVFFSVPVQAQDAGLTQALAEAARVATTFWHLAPDYVARETLNQKALTLPKRRLRAGASALEPPTPEFSHREIVSYYALSSFRASPEALHEFREIVSVDGQNIPGESGADKFRAILNGSDDKAKKGLLDRFEKASLAVAATDFGQLILLFTKGNQGKYNFRSGGSALVGADRASGVGAGKGNPGTADGANLDSGGWLHADTHYATNGASGAIENNPRRGARGLRAENG